MEKVHYESYQEKDKMLLKVLDENGNITDVQATKKEVHDKHLWHQEVAIFIINNEGKILLQRRSNNVHFNNGKWGMIANHVGINQSLVDALLQKAIEEIGYEINPNDIRYLTMLKRNEEREQRFTYFYYIKTDIKDEDINLNTYLATEKKWFDFYELQELMLINSEEVVFKNTPEYINIFGELSKIIKSNNTNHRNRKKEFIILNTDDGCFLPGLIQRSEKETKSIIIFIHGSGGNFFKSDYFNDMFEEFNYQGYDFMISNNRGAEQFARIHRKKSGINETIKAGNMYENFDESIFDISAAVNYAKEEGYTDIILVGQSLGTLKVQYYCEQVGDVQKVILLSPVDMVNRFKSRVKDKYDELIEKSKKLVAEGKGYEMVTNEFSALKIATTMAKGSKADLFKLEEDRDISTPLNYKGYISIIAGSSEHVYKGWDLSYVEKRLKERFKNAKFQFHTIPNSDHAYSEHEKQMAREIINSIRNMTDDKK
ncbi:MAG: NUDIX domain-containing protein [Clostridia bacterium]|nr:NUDIX domain-containing protein [Clostridia bacterium]